MWLPPIDISIVSSTAFGYYPRNGDSLQLSALYDSPRASSMTVAALLRPSGGLASTTSVGGIGKIPQVSFTQAKRPAASHALLVQTPDVYNSLDALAVLIQLYDEHGNQPGFDQLRALVLTSRKIPADASCANPPMPQAIHMYLQLH